MKSIFNAARRIAACLFAAVFLSALGAAPAMAQVTSLSMTSDPGDYIGQGVSHFYGPSDGVFNVTRNYQGGVAITFTGLGHWWNLYFSSANRDELGPGTYSNAGRFPFNPIGVAGLDVSGDGRGCNQLSGSFTVLQATYDSFGNVTAFRATFEQHCENGAPALRGEVRYNASVGLYLNAPAALQASPGQTTRFTVTATDSQQRAVRLSATSLPPGATFQDLGNNTGTFTWTPTTTQLGTFIASFQGDNQAGTVATMTTHITVIQPPPSNDEITTAMPISAFPATMSQNVTTATSNWRDPYCYGSDQSVWYSFTAPASMRIEVNTFGSSYDTALGVYTGIPGSTLSPILCNGDAGGGLQSRVRFDAVAGTTYYILVTSQWAPSTNANLILNVKAGPPPFTFSPSIQQFGTVVASTGQVTIHGTVTCSAPALVNFSGTVRQINAGVPVNGYWYATVPCDGVTPFSASVTSYAVFKDKGRATVIFGGGKATVGVWAYAYDPDTGDFKQAAFTTNVQLRGK